MYSTRVIFLFIVLGLTMYGASWTCRALLSNAAGRANAALIEAALRDDARAAATALRMGADPDARDREADRPALQWAILCRRTYPNLELHSHGQVPAGPPSVVRLLLAHGADPDATDQFGTRAIARARERNFSGVVALLEEAGAQD